MEQPRLRPCRVADRFGPVGLVRVLVAEVIAVGTAALLLHGRTVATGIVAVVAAALVAVTLIRRRGRWLLDLPLLWVRMRRRQVVGPAKDPQADPRINRLRWLVPNLTVMQVDGADGGDVGVGYDGAGWFAAAVLASPSALCDEGPAGRGHGLDRLVRVLADAGHRAATVGLVTEVQPAVVAAGSVASPAQQSYRQLLATYGASPAQRRTWMAVRLDARVLAEQEPGLAARHAPAVVAALATRLVAEAAPAGDEYHLLDADGLLTNLTNAFWLDAGPDRPQPGSARSGGPSPWPREQWRGWRVAGRCQVTFWVRRWPSRDASSRIERLLAAVHQVPAEAVVVCLSTVAGTGAVRCLIRLVDSGSTVERACSQLQRLARDHGADLLRLDGEQAPAAYAAGPTGGGGQ